MKVAGPLGALSLTVITAAPVAEVIALYTKVRNSVHSFTRANLPEVRHSVVALPGNIGDRVVGVPVGKPSH